MTDYPDTNGNGVPDAFENRPPITEVLNAPPDSLPCDRDSIIVEIEKRPRNPRKGEYFFCGSRTIQRAEFNYERHRQPDDGFMVIKRIIAGTLEDYGK